MKKTLFICVVFVMIIASAASLPFVLNAGFGQPPQGAQLTEVEASPHYYEGKIPQYAPDAWLYRPTKYAGGVVAIPDP